MNVEKVIRTRKSVRKYENAEINQELMNLIKQDLKQYVPVFHDTKVRFEVIDNVNRMKNSKLGFLWGLGKINAPCCIVGIYEDKEEGMLELGFALEQEVLKITENGYGTCWLGTFNKETFSDFCNLTEKEQIGIVIAVGKAKEEDFLNTRFRTMAGTIKRKTIQEICLNESQDTIDKEIINIIQLSILAPSGSNKQPVRVVIEDNKAYFYVLNERFVDAGIFISHFYLCAKEVYGDVKVEVENPNLTCYNINNEFTYVASMWLHK